MTTSGLINNQLVKIREYLTYRDYLANDISKVGVAWHLDHSLKVINQIVKILQNSKPEEYKKDFNMRRVAVFTAGRFPRGRARAPKTVLPPETIKTEDILQQLNEAKSNLESLDSLDKLSNFYHRIFGMLDLKDSIKFLEIHTNHHISIIRDIIKSMNKKRLSR